MASESYDYSDFTDRDDLISYKSLFAAEAPGLQGKMKLCEELQEMDRKEYKVVRLEEAQLKGLKGGDSRSASSYATLYIGLIALSICMIGYGIFQNSVFLVSAQACAIVYNLVCLTKILNPNSRQEEEKITQVFDNRLARLHTKIRNLDQKISQVQDPEIKEQLNVARDYFSTKYEIYTRVRIKDFIPVRV